jgi:hypothetical protein
MNTNLSVNIVDMDISGVETMNTFVDSSRMDMYGQAAGDGTTSASMENVITLEKCSVVDSSKENQVSFMKLLSRENLMSTSKIKTKRKYKTKTKPTHSSEQIMLGYLIKGPIKRKGRTVQLRLKLRGTLLLRLGNSD